MSVQPSMGARELVRQFERSYVNFHRLRKTLKDSGTPPVELYTPSERPLREDDVPHSLRLHLAEYRKSHPGESITLVKYMRTVNTNLSVVVEDESGLPPSDQILCLSQTLTLYSEETLDLVTELFVARRVRL